MVEPRDYPEPRPRGPESEGFGLVDWADTIVFDPVLSEEVPDSLGLRVASWQSRDGRQYRLSRAEVQVDNGEPYGIYELRSDPRTEAELYIGYSYDGWQGTTLPRDAQWDMVGSPQKSRLYEADMLWHLRTAPVLRPDRARTAPRFVREDFEAMMARVEQTGQRTWVRDYLARLLRKLRGEEDNPSPESGSDDPGDQDSDGTGSQDFEPPKL